MIPLVYFDTNVFIAAFKASGERAAHVWRVLGAAEGGDIDAVTSELTLAELLSKPPEDNPDLVARYASLISTRPGLTVHPVDRTVLLKAAARRRPWPLHRLWPFRPGEPGRAGRVRHARPRCRLPGGTAPMAP